VTPVAGPAATGSTSAEANPLANPVTAFLGSANVQKLIGLAGGGALSADVKTFWAKLASLSVGAAFALGVHYVDYLRAKIGR
jgi:hypothetical protein